jgi:Epoxide hydrolase N terminus
MRHEGDSHAHAVRPFREMGPVALLLRWQQTRAARGQAPMLMDARCDQGVLTLTIPVAERSSCSTGWVWRACRTATPTSPPATASPAQPPSPRSGPSCSAPPRCRCPPTFGRSGRNRAFRRHVNQSKEMAVCRHDGSPPFSIDVPEEELVKLRERVAATRWSETETVADQSQRVQLATIQELVRYWGTDYDLRRFEARLNALPQFTPRSTGSTSTSFTSSRRTRTPCR